jgi:cell division protein FtsW (lipid II flippase)
VARREREMLPRLIVLGVTATVAIQAVINLMVVTGLAPTKGIALPLLSSGGTGWILTSFCLGLVISIDRTQHAPEELPAPVAA